MLVEQRKIYLLDVILTFLPILLALCVVWYAPETIASRFDLEGNVKLKDYDYIEYIQNLLLPNLLFLNSFITECNLSLHFL